MRKQSLIMLYFTQTLSNLTEFGEEKTGGQTYFRTLYILEKSISSSSELLCKNSLFGGQL